MEKVKIGLVGLGQRGYSLLFPLLEIDSAIIVALCDKYQDRIDRAFDVIQNKQPTNSPKKFTSFDEFINYEEMDAVIIATSWKMHVQQAIIALKAKKIVGLEVGGANNLNECYELVKAYEKTKTPFMFLENCCYDKFELLTTSLVRANELGEIIHCHGAYSHDLREEIMGGNINRHYRLEEYINKNRDNYPTHALGPILKILNITRGNRFVSLTSYSSKSRGLKEFEKSTKNPDKTLANQDFKQGDVVNTIISCENGEVVTLTLNTTLPTYYSRELTVRGTKGLTKEEGHIVYLDKDMPPHEFYNSNKFINKYINNSDKYDDYLPDFWRNITEEERKLGHGGMDYFMIKDFINHIINKDEMPIDVYEAVALSSISPLTEQSIKHKGKTIKIPDFTKGKYKVRKQKDVVQL